MTFTIFDAVANINNRINSNNNNNNNSRTLRYSHISVTLSLSIYKTHSLQQNSIIRLSADNINFQQSVNTVVTGNINVANQINVMNVMGRRRRRSAGLKLSKQEKSRAARIARLGLESLITWDGLVEEEIFIQQLTRRLTQTRPQFYQNS